jgi:hypothetical protein
MTTQQPPPGKVGTNFANRRRSLGPPPPPPNLFEFILCIPTCILVTWNLQSTQVRVAYQHNWRRDFERVGTGRHSATNIGHGVTANGRPRPCWHSQEQTLMTSFYKLRDDDDDNGRISEYEMKDRTSGGTREQFPSSNNKKCCPSRAPATPFRPFRHRVGYALKSTYLEGSGHGLIRRIIPDVTWRN